MPNVKFLAPAVSEIWRGPRIRKLGHVNPSRPMYLVEGYFSEIGHKYLWCEWALLKRFTRSEVKGQGYVQAEYTTIHAYILIV